MVVLVVFELELVVVLIVVYWLWYIGGDILVVHGIDGNIV